MCPGRRRKEEEISVFGNASASAGDELTAESAEITGSVYDVAEVKFSAVSAVSAVSIFLILLKEFL